MKNLTFVGNDAGDWEALYVDGKLFCQGHEVETYDVLRALGIKCDGFDVSDDEMEELGCSFPDLLSEIPRS
jgi:hypothetical protein